MLSDSMVRRQALPTLSHIRKDMGRIRTPGDARRIFLTAARRTAADLGVEVNSIRDVFTRRLGLRAAADLYDLLLAWSQGRAEALADVLKAASNPAVHGEIDATLQGAAGRAGGFGEGAARWAAQPAMDTAMESKVIVLRDLDAKVLAALGDAAEAKGTTVEIEAAKMLERSVESSRILFSAWAADLRDRLRGTYEGDVVADIRTDRDR